MDSGSADPPDCPPSTSPPAAGRGHQCRAAVPSAGPSEPSLTEWLIAGLGAWPQALALIDEEATLIFTNPAARDAIVRVGWTILGGQLRCPDPDIHLRWLASLRQICGGGQPALFAMAGRDGESAFASLSPVVLGGQTRAFVAFGRAELCGLHEMRLFAAFQSLTQTETQVLHKLSLGLKPSEIARAHGVAASTVLTQVASIRAKTGSATVRQLLNTLSRLPPLMSIQA